MQLPSKFQLYFYSIREKQSSHGTQKTQTNQKNPGQNRRKAGGITIPEFKLCYEAIVTKAAWYKGKCVDQ